MSELLKDNMELERRIAAYGREPSQGQLAGRTRRREVPDVMSWLHSFSLYAAILCERHPQKTREMWAYQATVIAEARRCEGRGWLLYDSAFRQQAEMLTSLDKVDFSRINQSLYATMCLAGGQGQYHTTCMQPEHAALQGRPGVCKVPWQPYQEACQSRGEAIRECGKGDNGNKK